MRRRVAWKEKYLDYEIETTVMLPRTRIVKLLEKKSISITRLKLGCSGVIGWTLISPTWKEKYLDYEIETDLPDAAADNIRSWKEKYLDYEIETWIITFPIATVSKSWKEKYLDYEIETTS